ncbi:hypothetical protein L835_1885 [Mycobacteroides abscessus MAB_110811_1470]|nr:hypothetical protein L835_1885 [Mycobacteroides abscessus MAB_110811_1470]
MRRPALPHINDELEYDGNENEAKHTFQNRQYAPSTRSPLQPGPVNADHQYPHEHLGLGARAPIPSAFQLRTR